jgi:hypothetical protein
MLLIFLLFKEHDARESFFQHEEFMTLRDTMPECARQLHVRPSFRMTALT